jgi:hypothetical protein
VLPLRGERILRVQHRRPSEPDHPRRRSRRSPPPCYRPWRPTRPADCRRPPGSGVPAARSRPPRASAAAAPRVVEELLRRGSESQKRHLLGGQGGAEPRVEQDRLHRLLALGARAPPWRSWRSWATPLPTPGAARRRGRGSALKPRRRGPRAARSSESDRPALNSTQRRGPTGRSSPGRIAQGSIAR